MSKRVAKRVKFVKRCFAFVVLVFTLIFTGCAGGREVVFREVLVPVRCEEKLPIKPKFDGSFASARLKMRYYIACEQVAKICTGHKKK